MAGSLRRIALTLEYAGTNYSGYQYQLNGDSIQGRLETALSQVLGHKLTTWAASRTDAGVHARGQVAVFDLPETFPLEKVAPAINHHLPRDIRVVTAVPVPEDFNPQHRAWGKIYRYFICNRRQPPAIEAPYCWHIPGHLDPIAMNLGAQILRGRHDFAAFQAAGSPVTDTIRTIRHLWLNSRGQWLILTICGDGFLYNMVRIITGTLVEVGQGKITPAQVSTIQTGRDRSQAGQTAPARGLFLERVLYRPSLDSYSRL